VYKRGFAKVNKQRIPLTDNQIISDKLGEKAQNRRGLSVTA
jgi:hypothetical protein